MALSTVSPRGRAARFLIVLGALNAAMSSALYITVLPPLARELSIGEAATGLITSLGAVTFALVAPLWGVRVDTWGRKRTLLIGLAGYGVASAGFAGFAWLGLTGALTGVALYVALLLARPLGGVLAAAVPSAGQAYMADITSKDDRTAGMGLIGAAQGLGMVIGPALGAAFAGFGVLTPIWATVFAASVSALAIALFLPESDHAREPAEPEPAHQPDALATPGESRPAEPSSEPVGGFRAMLTRRETRLPLTAYFVLFATVGIIDGTLGFHLQDTLDLTTVRTIAHSGTFLLTVGVALIVVQVGVVGYLKPAPLTALRLGLTGMAVGIVCYLLADSLPLFIGSAVVFGLSAGMAISGAMATASIGVGAAEQGRMAGLMTMTQGAGFACGPFLGGLAYQWQPLSPILFCGGAMVVVAVWTWLFRVPTAPEPASADTPADVGASSVE